MAPVHPQVRDAAVRAFRQLLMDDGAGEDEAADAAEFFIGQAVKQRGSK